MLPNLADVFYWVGSQGQIRKELTKLFFRILTISPKFQTYLIFALGVNLVSHK